MDEKCRARRRKGKVKKPEGGKAGAISSFPGPYAMVRWMHDRRQNSDVAFSGTTGQGGILRRKLEEEGERKGSQKGEDGEGGVGNIKETVGRSYLCISIELRI